MKVLEAMMQPRIAALPARIQGVYLQNAVKLYADAFKRFGFQAKSQVSECHLELCVHGVANVDTDW